MKKIIHQLTDPLRYADVRHEVNKFHNNKEVTKVKYFKS